MPESPAYRLHRGLFLLADSRLEVDFLFQLQNAELARRNLDRYTVVRLYAPPVTELVPRVAGEGVGVVAAQRVEGEHLSLHPVPLEHQGGPHVQGAPQAQCQ